MISVNKEKPGSYSTELANNYDFAIPKCFTCFFALSLYQILLFESKGYL